MKVWITRYALTVGIIEAEAVKSSSNFLKITEGEFEDSWFTTRDCCECKQEAIKKAEEMRRKKIESLKKQINKLEKMRFE